MADLSRPGFFAYWKQDLPAALVVFLVALPLCLGIAMASGAPLISGIIAGIVGGLVVGALSQSQLSVAGPAAGLAVIVLEALTTLPAFEAFLLAVCIAGVMQIGLGMLRAGVIGDFVPNAVINGMLAAIGIILALKQIPHALGYDAGYVADAFVDGIKDAKLFSSLAHVFSEHVTYGAAVISLSSLAFLFWWDSKRQRMENALKYIPGPLVAVAAGVAMAEAFRYLAPGFVIPANAMVKVPEVGSVSELGKLLTFPDFSYIGDPAIWTVAATLALVASIESLLSVEAVDRLDPYRRTTPCNRELMAQGAGNTLSGLLGGLPVTSVIVRSSANVGAGARTKLSAIAHAALLLVCVACVPWMLNSIPLASLAAVLLSVAYKLAAPALFVKKYKDGLRRFLPFIATIAAILLTDLLIGVAIGTAICVLLLLADNFRSAVSLVKDNDAHYMLRLKKDVFFTHKPQLKRALAEIPDNATLLLDISSVDFVDRDNVEIINRFLGDAEKRNMAVRVKANDNKTINEFFNAGKYATA